MGKSKNWANCLEDLMISRNIRKNNEFEKISLGKEIKNFWKIIIIRMFLKYKKV